MMIHRHLTRWAGLGLVAGLLSACAGGTRSHLDAAQPAGNHPFPVRATTHGSSAHDIHGIDIAKYQGDIDWHAVKRSGVAFAFIKATEGTDRLDDKFHQNWAAARAAGLPRGAYHFNYWCTPFRAQFEWFRRNVPRDPDAMPPVLDLEWNTHSPTCPRRRSRAYAQREIRTFLRLAEAWYGKRPIIYTDIRFYRDVLADGSFAQYPLWVRSTRKLPHVVYSGRKWAFWQYSDRSRIPGIRGRVDKNAFAGSRRDWNRLVASNFAHKPAVIPAAEPAGPAKPKPAAPAPVMVADGEPKAQQESATAVAAAKPAPGQRPPATTTTTTIAAAEPGQTKDTRLRARAYAPAGKPLSLTPLALNPKKAKAVARR